jgi:hypothetical protein
MAEIFSQTAGFPPLGERHPVRPHSYGQPEIRAKIKIRRPTVLPTTVSKLTNLDKIAP